MKRWIPWIVGLVVLLWLAIGVRPPRQSADGFDTSVFGRLPVLSGGRIQPLDSVARNSLLIISGRQVVRDGDGRHDASRWLAELMFDSGKAEARPIFLINNPEVLGLFGWQQGGRKRFAYRELEPFLSRIDEQGSEAAELEASQRSPYQTGALNLRNALFRYQQLRDMEAFFSVPSADGGEWQAMGEAMLAAENTRDPLLLGYAAAGDAFAAGNAGAFHDAVAGLSAELEKRVPDSVKRASIETTFNLVQPFYLGMGLCLLAFLLACGSWMSDSLAPPLRKSASGTLVTALVLMTAGFAARMYLQGRPPVTNLYSSAIFIGWGTVLIGLVLEKIHRDGIGAACAGMIGFVALVIAHHLAGNGDTLQMLQAVLDTNIWLATHVVVITFGYCAMFLAGMLAILYVLRGRFSRRFEKTTADGLQRMVYGVICFATLFSFVGTVLGGIWADQSWGRFWGWDPKENGALLIVLWCALILHARWGGYIRQRGLMIMAIFGNVITAFSWFGVNMLGVGLHSYGFMDKAFPWLVAFVVSQLVLMLLATPPLTKWRGLRVTRMAGQHRRAVGEAS